MRSADTASAARGRGVARAGAAGIRDRGPPPRTPRSWNWTSRRRLGRPVVVTSSEVPTHFAAQARAQALGPRARACSPTSLAARRRLTSRHAKDHRVSLRALRASSAPRRRQRARYGAEEHEQKHAFRQRAHGARDRASPASIALLGGTWGVVPSRSQTSEYYDNNRDTFTLYIRAPRVSSRVTSFARFRAGQRPSRGPATPDRRGRCSADAAEFFFRLSSKKSL
jgi:hypothetical protein